MPMYPMMTIIPLQVHIIIIYKTALSHYLQKQGIAPDNDQIWDLRPESVCRL